MAFAAVTELTSQVWPSLPVEYFQPRWYAAYTCARHEKRVAEQLQQRSVELFLPLYETVHRWRNGRARVTLPLFPGYVFVHIALKDRLRVLEIPSVVRLVGFNGHPMPLAELEIQSIQTCLARNFRLEPHPYLRPGRRVRVKSGPLQGLEGTVLRKKNRFRIVISFELIMRSVAVEIDDFVLEPTH